MIVIKRDNSKEVFNLDKIINAVKKAFIATGEYFPEEQIRSYFGNLYDETFDQLEIEHIQDSIAMYLMQHHPQVAQNFITYRYERQLLRESSAKLMSDVDKKLKAINVVNQNANINEYSFSGRLGEATRIVTKKHALENCMSKMARKNHEDNIIYIHDLDSYAVGEHNCLSQPIDDLLEHGCKIGSSDIRPASSVNSALHLIPVYFQIQSQEQFGGVSATHIDWSLVPYVRKSFYKHYKVGEKWMWLGVEEEVTFDNPKDISIENPKYLANRKIYDYAMERLQEEINQGIEAFYHNLNTLQSRSGGQLPFTSINYGTCTLPEGRMIIKAILEGSIKGIGKYGKTSIFPCGIFKCKKGVNRAEGDPNYDLFKLALYSTSLRIYPNYANVDWSGNAGYDPNDPRTEFSTMGCRTANGWDINGLGQLKDGRGNICPVTIILPTIAMMANRDVEKFMKLLDKKIEEAKDMLIERFEYIASQSEKSAPFMWINRTMAGYVPEEGIRSALKHGTLAMGQLGLAETLQLLIGCDHTTEEGMELAKRIEQLFKDRCAEYKQEYRLNFGVYYTPAESLCHTALKKFRAKYGVIENVSDKEFFTNSIHVPVWKEINPFEKIDIESQLTGYSSAGCITYVELPSGTNHNIEALETLVNYAMDKDIPYFAINIPIDNCDDCGHSGEMNDTCPKCGSKNITHLRRVTGYLTGDKDKSFNAGKLDEESKRVKHVQH